MKRSNYCHGEKSEPWCYGFSMCRRPDTLTASLWCDKWQKKFGRRASRKSMMGYYSCRVPSNRRTMGRPFHAFSRSNVFGGWRGAGLLPFNPEKVLRNIEIPPPSTETHQTLPPPNSPTHESLDPALFNSSLLTSSPLNAEAFGKTASALRAEVEQKKVLATVYSGAAINPPSYHHHRVASR